MKKTLLLIVASLTSSLFAQDAFDINFNDYSPESSFTQQASGQFTRNGDGSDLIVQDKEGQVLRLEAKSEMGTPTSVIQTKDLIFGPFTGKVKASVEIRPGPGVHLVGFYQSRDEALRRALIKFEAKEITAQGMERTGGSIGTYDEGKWYRIDFEIEADGTAERKAHYTVKVTDLQSGALAAETSTDVLATGNPEFISGGVLQVGAGNDEAAHADFRHWKILSEKSGE